jgi:hypothetical protein
MLKNIPTKHDLFRTTTYIGHTSSAPSFPSFFQEKVNSLFFWSSQHWVNSGFRHCNTLFPLDKNVQRKWMSKDHMHW